MKSRDKEKNNPIAAAFKSVFLPNGYSDRLRLPPGCGGPSQTVLTGVEMAEFDGCNGLVSYANDHVTLSLSDRIVTVYGNCLCLKTFSMDHIAVCGRIYGVLEGEYREEITFADH